jgi:hypothetical protein
MVSRDFQSSSMVYHSFGATGLKRPESADSGSSMAARRQNGEITEAEGRR